MAYTPMNHMTNGELFEDLQVNQLIDNIQDNHDNKLDKGSNNLDGNLKLFGKDGVSNVSVNKDHADLTGVSLHKDSSTGLFDRGIGYTFTPDKIVFQHYATDSEGGVDTVTTEYKQTTKNIELGADKVIINPTSSFAVNGAMTVTATDKAAKFDTKTFESKVQNTFTIKDANSNKLFEIKSSQTKINNRLDVTESERNNTLSLKKDGFETKVNGSSGVTNWQKMTAGGNPFAFGVENDSDINDGAKTSLLNALPDGSIYIYGVDGYDGLSTLGKRSLQIVVSDLDTEINNINDSISDLQDNKQDALVAGNGINIINNVISAAGEVVDILTKNAQIRVTISDCATYENLWVWVSTSVSTYHQHITSAPSDGYNYNFDFDIQYTNADPLVKITVISETGYATVDGLYMRTGFWISEGDFLNIQIFNQNLDPMPLSFIGWQGSGSHYNGDYRGFSFQINLKDYDINTDGRVQVCDVPTSTMCYTEDTLITLSDGTTKKVQDITYNDILKVWNFDEGKSDSAKPIWIKIEQEAPQYALVKLSDGNSIKLVGTDGKYHCMYDVDEQKFNHAIDCVGHNVYTENGIVKVESLEIVNEPVKFYNIVTDIHLNCYANHILTSTEKNNIYPIEDMKFVKDDRELKPYKLFKQYCITSDEYTGWRLAEQPMSVEECVQFIDQRRKSQK